MNIIDIFRQYAVPFREHGQHHHSTRGWIQIDCPSCSKGRGSFRLGFNIKNKYFNCFSCGPARLIDTLMEVCGLNFAEVKQLLDDYDPLLLTDTSKPIVRKNLVTLPKNLGKLQAPHLAYLKGRGLDVKRIKKLWGIKGIGLSSYLQWRIFIPVIYDGEIISWTTRSISDDVDKRYIAASMEDEKLPGKSVLYGEDYCKDSAIIVEGPIDAWKIGPGAVATLGTDFTQSQLLRMTNYSKRIICMDAAPEGQVAAQKLMAFLLPFPGRTINVVLETAKDPGKAKPSEIRELRAMLR